MAYQEIKAQLQDLMNHQYQEFVEALISIETGEENEKELVRLYEAYMQNDTMGLLNDCFTKEK